MSLFVTFLNPKQTETDELARRAYSKRTETDELARRTNSKRTETVELAQRANSTQTETDELARRATRTEPKPKVILKALLNTTSSQMVVNRRVRFSTGVATAQDHLGGAVEARLDVRVHALVLKAAGQTPHNGSQ
jgi:hypothetical protein